MGKITRRLLFIFSVLFLASSRAPAQTTGIAVLTVFQYTIFYNPDLEVEPGANQTIIGNVHCNSNIWLAPNPGVTLTFSNDVTAGGLINETPMPDDPIYTTNIGTIAFDGLHDGGAEQLNPVPIPNNTSNEIQILQIPPPGESPDSLLGSNRFYNLADTVLLISNNTVTALSQASNGTGTTIPTNIWRTFLNTNVYFWNGRENLSIQADLINISNLVSWAQAASNTQPNGVAPNTIYIADERSLYFVSNYFTVSHGHTNSNTVNVPIEPGILLYNGAELPSSGLTVASPDPVYIWGNYNTTTNRTVSSQSTHNTAYTRPAAVLGDAITVLSSAWNTNSQENSSAVTTTINAALVAGIVPTSTNSSSGGVNNFPRLLENWGGDTLWFNGSIVCMYYSEIATGLWVGTGGYYDPPTRNWSFDTNFFYLNKLPPHTLDVALSANAYATNSLVSSAQTVLPGSTVTLTTTVSGVAPLGLTSPWGAIYFRTNGVVAGSWVLPIYGTAATSVPLGRHGSNYIAAEFTGDYVYYGCTNVVGVIVNNPPVAGSCIASVEENSSLSIATAKLLSYATDADADPLSITNITSTSTNGGTVQLSGDHSTITYTPMANYSGNDAIIYSVNDTYTNVTGKLYVTVVSRSAQSQNILATANNGNGTVTLTAAGVPGYPYHIQATTSMVPPAPWVDLSGSSTTAPANGIWTFTDPYASNYATRFYCTVSP